MTAGPSRAAPTDDAVPALVGNELTGGIPGSGGGLGGEPGLSGATSF